MQHQVSALQKYVLFKFLHTHNFYVHSNFYIFLQAMQRSHHTSTDLPMNESRTNFCNHSVTSRLPSSRLPRLKNCLRDSHHQLAVIELFNTTPGIFIPVHRLAEWTIVRWGAASAQKRTKRSKFWQCGPRIRGRRKRST